MINFLHVVAIFQHIDQTQQFRRSFRVHVRFGRRDHRDFSGVRFQAGGFQRIAYRAHLFPRGINVNRAVVIGHNVFRARFQRRFHDRIFVAFLEGDNAFFAEQVGNGTVGPQVTAGFGEGMTDFRNGTVTVVGQTFNHHRRAARTVTFIDDGFHVCIIIAAHAAGNSAVQGVAGHVVAQRFVDCRAQTRVRSRIAAAQTRGGDQLANNFRKDLTALGILCRFAVLGVGPFTMTCHKKLSKKARPFRRR